MSSGSDSNELQIAVLNSLATDLIAGVSPLMPVDGSLSVALGFKVIDTEDSIQIRDDAIDVSGIDEDVKILGLEEGVQIAGERTLGIDVVVDVGTGFPSDVCRDVEGLFNVGSIEIIRIGAEISAGGSTISDVVFFGHALESGMEVLREVESSPALTVDVIGVDTVQNSVGFLFEKGAFGTSGVGLAVGFPNVRETGTKEILVVEEPVGAVFQSADIENTVSNHDALQVDLRISLHGILLNDILGSVRNIHSCVTFSSNVESSVFVLGESFKELNEGSPVIGSGVGIVVGIVGIEILGESDADWSFQIEHVCDGVPGPRVGSLREIA